MYLDNPLNTHGSLFSCHSMIFYSKFPLFPQSELHIRNVNVQPLKEAHATQNIDKVRILNSIALSRLGTCDFELFAVVPR